MSQGGSFLLYEGEKSAEDFWVKAERLLYCALIGYIWYEAPAEEMNFTTLLELINASEAREDDEEYQSPVDLLFADLEAVSYTHLITNHPSPLFFMFLTVFPVVIMNIKCLTHLM